MSRTIPFGLLVNYHVQRNTGKHDIRSIRYPDRGRFYNLQMYHVTPASVTSAIYFYSLHAIRRGSGEFDKMTFCVTGLKIDKPPSRSYARQVDLTGDCVSYAGRVTVIVKRRKRLDTFEVSKEYR